MHYNKINILTVAIFTVLNISSCNQSGHSNDNYNDSINYKSTRFEPLTDQNNTNAANDESTNDQDDDTGTNKLEFLKELNGKYPNEVKLLENAALIERLKKLLGEERYNYLNETWAVETPMEYKDNIFLASACQVHNCASTNFIIVYNFSTNILYAGIREDNQVKTYADDGSSSQEINNWVNGN